MCRIPNAIKKHGSVNALKMGFAYCADLLFDIKYKTDTFAFVALNDLGIDDSDKESAYMYEPTHAIPLNKLFKKMNINSEQVLLDLGCGKGRVLLIASQFPFKELRGIDLSDKLCDIAKKNCTIYKNKMKTKVEFSIFNVNVVNYKIQDDETVFFPI